MNWVIASGMSATMPAKITIDDPLPMPDSVISSPNHMMTTVPVVIVTTVSRWNDSPWMSSATTALAPELPPRPCTYEAANHAWTIATRTVP
jgi:hypothetical protein